MNVAVLGYGNVGSSLCEALEASNEIGLKWILRRPGRCTTMQMTDDIETILKDPEVDAVCDVLPGVHPSYEYMKAALEAGKAVVTANKAALCCGFKELTALAKAKKLPLLYEASCGGTIPCVAEAVNLAKSNEITKVFGIMNGTTNFILDKMDREGADFGTVLAEAQRLGYAEADPTADLSGFDVKNKVVILSNTAYGSSLTTDFPVCGIEKLTKKILDGFKAEGKMLKLIGISVKKAERYAIGVVPMVFPAEALEAHVPANYNLFTLEGTNCGAVKLYGQGAGGVPTADAVMRDLMTIKKGEASAKTAAFEKELIYDPSLLYGKGYADGTVTEGTLEDLCAMAKEKDVFLAFEPAEEAK